jgi:hypothetical protein
LISIRFKCTIFQLLKIFFFSSQINVILLNFMEDFLSS